MAAVDASPADVAEVEAIVKASGTSFHQGMKILPPERRRAMYAIYAFCRVVDDIADEPAAAQEKQAGLDEWRHRIVRLYEGKGNCAITRVLLAPVVDYRLRREDFMAVIEGMEMDAFREIVAPSWEELDHYCDCAAAAVGRLSVRAFGEPGQRGLDVAWALGRALQFTNILRDIAEDADRGRVYLPGGWLRDAGIDSLNPREIVQSPALPEVCDRMAAQAERYFTAAENAMKDCDRRAMRPARLMGVRYRAILRRLQARGWRRLAKSVKVPKALTLWFVLRHGLV